MQRLFLYPVFKTELVKYTLKTAHPTPHLPAVSGAVLLAALQIHISRYKWWVERSSKQANLHSSPTHTTTRLPGYIFKYQSSLSFKTPPKTCHSHICSSVKLERPSDRGMFMIL